MYHNNSLTDLDIVRRPKSHTSVLIKGGNFISTGIHLKGFELIFEGGDIDLQQVRDICSSRASTRKAGDLGSYPGPAATFW